MAQIPALVAALKKALKSHGLTYADVAEALGLSEASVKRLFSNQDFTLDRLERIAALMQMDFADLVRLMEDGRDKLTQLSVGQEEELVADTRLLLAAVCALNHWRFEEILDTYALGELELVRLLARLDRLKFVELLPGNRIRPCVARDFHWRPDGPIERFFRARVQQDFLAAPFDGAGERLAFATGMLSWAANAQLQERIARLLAEFAEAHRRDTELPLSDRHGNCLLVALRPYEFGAFEALRRR